MDVGCVLVWGKVEKDPLVFPLADILQRPRSRGANAKQIVAGP